MCIRKKKKHLWGAWHLCSSTSFHSEKTEPNASTGSTSRNREMLPPSGHFGEQQQSPIDNSHFVWLKVKKWNTPGVKKCPIEEAAVVVVAHKVPGDGLPGAGLGHDLIGHCDPIFGVVEVQEHHVKHQRRLSGDVAAWRQRHQRRWRPGWRTVGTSYLNTVIKTSAEHLGE